MKKVLTSTDDVVLSEIKVALRYFGRPSLQKQGRAAYVLLRYELTYMTFSAAENIPVPKGEEFLTALILTDFKNLRQVGLEGSNSERPEVAEVAESDQSGTEDEALHLAFEEAGLNLADPPSTSGREDLALDDIFHGLEDLPGAYPEDMAGLSLTQLAKKANVERMAARRRAEAIRTGVPPAIETQPSLLVSKFQLSLPVIEEGTAENRSAEAELVVQADREAELRAERRSAEVEVGSEDNCAVKRPRLEESDVIVPFVIQPKIKNTSIPSDASVIKDLAVALSMATSVSLSADKAVFRAEPDLVSIALAAQSALLTVGRIAEMGRRHHDAIEQLGRLQTEVKGQRIRAEFEALRAKMEGAWAEAEMERAWNAEELRLAAERRVDASEGALKLSQEAVSKLEAELEEVKKAKEAADSEASKALEAGKSAALAEYVDEVSKFENRGFKHGWLKALAAADVTLAMPIPYEQVDIEPLEFDSED